MTPGKYRKLTVSSPISGQTIHIFGEGLAIYPVPVGFEINAPKTSSPRIRSAEGSKGGLLLLLVTSAVWVSRISKLSAADSSDQSYLETSDHPYLETKDRQSETCLKCHPAKNQGKFVHTAVGMGCENCHQAASADDKTTITLRATGGELCSKCHEINVNPIMHGPYKAGQCLVCHDPHTGAYPAQTRAAASTLCLGCHMLNQPDTRVNAETKTVSLLDGRTYDLPRGRARPRSARRILRANRLAAQAPRLPNKEPGKPKAESDCLTCHDPAFQSSEASAAQSGGSRGQSRKSLSGIQS